MRRCAGGPVNNNSGFEEELIDVFGEYDYLIGEDDETSLWLSSTPHQTPRTLGTKFFFFFFFFFLFTFRYYSNF